MLALLIPLALAEAPPVAAEMHTRFATTMRIRDHLVQGELEPAKALAAALLDPELEGLPKGWAERTADLSAHATTLAKATDLATASQALANLGATCAGCHEAEDGGPGLEGMRGIPPQSWSQGDNMPLHLWAVDWMWLGLVAPDDSAWDRGAAELDSQPLALRFGDDEPTAKALETRVYALAKEAEGLGPAKHAERARVMGELLTTCATCHTLRDAAKTP